MNTDPNAQGLRTIAGHLYVRSYGEADEILFLSTDDRPLAEVLEWMSGHRVTVRYWLTDRECTRGEAIEAHVLTLFGSASVDFGARYSEITGYLWTDEDLVIGGHDLLAELKSGAGRWLILEVEVHA